MNKMNRLLAASILLLAQAGVSPATGAAEKFPDSTTLIGKAFDNPSHPYEGQMVVSTWTDDISRAEDVKIYFLPPDKYRFEFLAPNGTVDRVVISDKTREQIQLMENGRVSRTSITEIPSNALSPAEEKNLLLTNYLITVKPSELVSGRPAWTVELSPRTPGKPHQVMRIDQATYVVLEIKRFAIEGNKGSLMRFTQFAPRTTISPALFSAKTMDDSGLKKDSAEYSMVKVDLASDQKHPKELRGGFSASGMNHFEVTGRQVTQIRYTDGLMPVSLFQTPAPVKTPADQDARFITWHRPLQMGTTGSNTVYQWRNGRNYYTLVGEIQPALLKEIAANIH